MVEKDNCRQISSLFIACSCRIGCINEVIPLYEGLTGLRFSGAAFTEETAIEFFPPSDKSSVRASLIFGKNGSGKTTISNAILKSCNRSSIEGIRTAHFLDAENNELNLLDPELEHIFVFNEKYTEQNVRIKRDGLNTIVMLGEQVDLDEKIKKAKSAHDVAVEARSMQEVMVKKYGDKNSVSSPDYYIEKMTKALQGDDNWAGRERIISGTRTNAPVKSDTYKRIIQHEPTVAKSDIHSKYEESLSALRAAADESARIKDAVPVSMVELMQLGHKEKEIVDLLAVQLQKPELSDREKYLLSLVESGKTAQLDEMQSFFTKSQVAFCPFCLQPVSSQHKEELVGKIQMVLNKEVEEHRVALKSIAMVPVSLDLSPFSALDASVLLICEDSLDSLNKAIELCSEKLSEKGGNVYTPFLDMSFQLEERQKELVDNLQDLERHRTEFNAKFDQLESIRKHLNVLNSQMAYYDIEGFFDDYEKQKEESEKERRKLANLIADEKKCEEVHSDLIQQKKSIRIAVDVINRGLQYVFFSKERLRIDVRDDLYTLISNGHPVRPSDVSSGERNIISLCYFFTEVMRNLDDRNAYSQECFLIIDDPVSSFDWENRIGILSYLKSQLLNILGGNRDSKILLMTHDLSAFFDLEKILGEVKDAAEKKHGRKTTDYSLLELSNRTLVRFKERKRHEYSELLKVIYEYASDISSDNELVIGNVMRRTLEAFSTFEYKKGMDAISCDERILASMGDDAYSTYFQNLMYRLVLNGESHAEEKVRSLTDLGFSSLLTTEEKRQTAKDVLCLMNVLNPHHVQAHLSEMPNATRDVQEWCKSIAELYLRPRSEVAYVHEDS